MKYTPYVKNITRAKETSLKEQDMINEYLGTSNPTKCPTDYARENKQATSKQGYGESMTTAFTPVSVECDEDTPISEYDITIEYVSVGWQKAMIEADKRLYRDLMMRDDKFKRVLQRVKKHIKRKARAKANKLHKQAGNNVAIGNKSRVKRAIPIPPSQRGE